MNSYELISSKRFNYTLQEAKRKMKPTLFETKDRAARTTNEGKTQKLPGITL